MGYWYTNSLNLEVTVLQYRGSTGGTWGQVCGGAGRACWSTAQHEGILAAQHGAAQHGPARRSAASERAGIWAAHLKLKSASDCPMESAQIFSRAGTRGATLVPAGGSGQEGGGVGGGGSRRGQIKGPQGCERQGGMQALSGEERPAGVRAPISQLSTNTPVTQHPPGASQRLQHPPTTPCLAQPSPAQPPTVSAPCARKPSLMKSPAMPG